MNTALQNTEEEMANVGRAKGGARFMPQFDWTVKTGRATVSRRPKPGRSVAVRN